MKKGPAACKPGPGRKAGLQRGRHRMGQIPAASQRYRNAAPGHPALFRPAVSGRQHRGGAYGPAGPAQTKLISATIVE